MSRCGYTGYGTACARDRNGNLVDHLYRFIGQTVTIFTTSGGISGAGFTGILLAVEDDYVRLATHIGPAPACPIGSNCLDEIDDRRKCRRRDDGRFPISTVGSVTDIPIRWIAAFTHNAI